MKIAFLNCSAYSLNAAALHVLQLHDPGQLLAIDAVGIVDYAVGVGDRDRLRAQVEQLLDRVLRNVAAARNQADLAVEGFLAGLQHFLREVDAAVAGGFGTNQRAAPVQALAGEHAGELVPDALVLSEQEADLASAHADVAGGNVGIGPMWRYSSVMKLWQKRITSLSLLPLGSKSEPPLPPPMGRVVRRVLEDLLEGEELQDAQVHRGWKRSPPL